MPDGFADASGDGVDFQPEQPKPRKATPQVRPSDGIDFQLGTAPSRSGRSGSASRDGIDFQIDEKPYTLDDLIKQKSATPSLTERSAQVGQPSPLTQSLSPHFVDLTKVPVDPFTNRYVTRPPLSTEEEKQRHGTIAANDPGIGGRILRALGAGAPAGSKAAEWTGQPGVRSADEMRLVAPEQLMTATERARHPILTGAGEFAGGLTSPEALTVAGLTGGAGDLAGPGAQVAKRLLAAGFSGQMLYNAAQKSPEVADAIRRGDDYTAERLITQMVLEAGTAGLAARGTLEEPTPTTVPKGTISRPLALDEAVARGDRAAQVNAQAETGLTNVDEAVRQGWMLRAAKRGLQRADDFAANAAARRGMGQLAEAERGIDAARQARINAPVDVPKTYEGEPTLLPNRPLGPERNPLEVEAARVREERAERAKNEQPDFRILDLRRVVPENPQEQAYYEIPEHYDIPAVERPMSGKHVEPAPVGETIGAKSRSAAMTDLASRLVPRIEGSLLGRFGPELLDEAREELKAAGGLASSFERAGRYFNAISQMDPHFIKEDPKAGIRYGGNWYGVTSARKMIEDMHPWYRGVEEGPETLARTIQQGKGAAYDRLLEQAATQIQSERESARPVIEEFAPQLRSLAGQIRDTDPDLAQTMQYLADGRVRGVRNLREYVERTINNAEAAAEFSHAIDEAAAEARDAAGIEETSEPSSGAREREGTPPGELDFQPFPEPQSIHPEEVEEMSRLLGRRVTAEELPEIRRRLDAERNIAEGLRGNRRDLAGEIREEHRSELEHDPTRVGESWIQQMEADRNAGPTGGLPDYLREQRGHWFSPNQAYARSYGKNLYAVDVPLAVADATRYQHGEHVLPDVWQQRARPADSIGELAEGMVRLFRGAGAEEAAFRAGQERRPKTDIGPDYEGAGNRLGLEFRGVIGADAGLGDKAVVTYQDPVSRGSIGIRVGEWSPERVSEQLAQKRKELSATGSETAERYSGLHPRALTEGARTLQRAWEAKIARPLIDRVLKIGDKYAEARAADPAVAEGLQLLDNAPSYLRAKAAQEVHNVIGNLSRAQERLFTLMADATSRENLRTNHPQEFAQAQRDPAIQEALRKYRPLEQELTRLRQQMGGATIEDDYLRRVYDKYIAGVGHAEAPGSPERGTSAYDRVIRPQRIGKMSREATAEYHYQNGLHELGPSFATKFVATHLRALRDQVARQFIGEATFVPTGGSEPRFILYRGERYYRPDVAREMVSAGKKGAKAYDRYDPTAGEKFPIPAEGRFLGPRELVKTLTDFGRREDVQPGGLRRFFQEQILGFGFGAPHVANIMRRVSQSVPGGAANPKGWVDAWRVVFSKELRDRGIAGLNDPTFDKLAQRGAISTGEWGNLKEYWGGNLNPANWLQKMAGVGHKALFEPGSFGGFGGIDQRARIYIADLVKSQRPEFTDSQIAESVRTQLGDYNRANWSDRQKMLAKFMMFPGWDASSIRWVLQHPIKTTVPPALVVLLANQALRHLGQNRPEDQYDISNVHIGDRAYGTSLLRESVARNLFRPALTYAQSKIRGESDQRAMAEAARGFTSGAGGLLGMLRPDLSGFLALATNRQALFSGKEIVSKDDFARPGQLLPSRAVEKEAIFALRHAVPALDRMLDSNEEIDLRSFAGGNLGMPNYRDDAEKHLLRNAAEAEEVHRTISKLTKSNPELARQYVKDPDNAAFALFYHDLEGLTATLKRMDETRERIEASGLPADDKRARLANIEKARENLLQHADGLSNLLFERRQKVKPSGQLPSSGFLRGFLPQVRQEATQP